MTMTTMMILSFPLKKVNSKLQIPMKQKLSGVVYRGALWTFFYYAKIVVLFFSLSFFFRIYIIVLSNRKWGGGVVKYTVHSFHTGTTWVDEQCLLSVILDVGSGLTSCIHLEYL